MFLNTFKVTAIKALRGRLFIGMKDVGIMIYDTDALRILKIELIRKQMKQ